MTRTSKEGKATDTEAMIATFSREQEKVLEGVRELEEVVEDIRENGIRKETGQTLSRIFQRLDEELLGETEKEGLRERLSRAGNLMIGNKEWSPPDVVGELENDLLAIKRESAVAFNLFGLATRLPGHDSRLIVLDAALEKTRSLVETIRFYLMREEEKLFPLIRATAEET